MSSRLRCGTRPADTARGRRARFGSPLKTRSRNTSSSLESTPMRICTMFSRTCKPFAEMVRLKADTTYVGAPYIRAFFFAAFALFAVIVVPGAAQGVDQSLLLKPTPDSWPTYHGDYSGQHHSRLTQITPANVRQMTLTWAFQTNQGQSIKATPILVNGIIYVTTVDNLWAVDARSGRQIWRYTYPP